MYRIVEPRTPTELQTVSESSQPSQGTWLTSHVSRPYVDSNGCKTDKGNNCQIGHRIRL